jgi:hypothetical protein
MDGLAIPCTVAGEMAEFNRRTGSTSTVISRSNSFADRLRGRVDPIPDASGRERSVGAASGGTQMWVEDWRDWAGPIEFKFDPATGQYIGYSTTGTRDFGYFETIPDGPSFLTGIAPQQPVRLPSNLRDLVAKRVNNPATHCGEFISELIAEAGRINGKAYSTDLMANFDRIQREAGFKLKEQDDKGTANFEGNKRVVYIKPVSTSSDPRRIANVQTNYAGTALNEVIHHAKDSGVYGDRTMARAIFNILPPAEQKSNPHRSLIRCLRRTTKG